MTKARNTPGRVRATPRRKPGPPAAPVFPQERARATRRALLEAARLLFADKGYDAAQTPDIAAAAGVSVGTFYRYFDDKRQVFVEMIRAHLDEGHERVMARLTAERFGDGDNRAAIDLTLEVMFEFVARFPSLMRLALEMALRDPEVDEARLAFEERAEDGVAALIAQVVPRRVVPDARAAAVVLVRSTMEVALATTADGRRRGRASQAAVKLALREMIHRYLFPSR